MAESRRREGRGACAAARSPLSRWGGRRLLAGLATLFVTLWLGCGAAAFAGQPSPTNLSSTEHVKALALEWYEHMQSGQIDRTQLAKAYSDQLTDDAVQEMARYLKTYGPADGAQILQTRTMGRQTFYLVKLFLQRGDAMALLIGLDEAGKITGIAPANMGQG